MKIHGKIRKLVDLNTGSSRGSKKKIRAGIHKKIHKKIQEPCLDPQECGSNLDLSTDLDPQAGSGSYVYRYCPLRGWGKGVDWV